MSCCERTVEQPATASGSSFLLSRKSLHASNTLFGGNELPSISKMENEFQPFPSQLWLANGAGLYACGQSGPSNASRMFWKWPKSGVTMGPLMTAIYLLSMQI